MNNNRLTKLVYLWDRSIGMETWSTEVRSIFSEADQKQIYDSEQIFPLKVTISNIKEHYLKTQTNELELQCLNMPKLRTFITFKDFHSVPSYLTKPLNFLQRRFMAKIRLGCLALRIETGRYSRPRLIESDRICQVCKKENGQSEFIGRIESEIHFIFQCNRYSAIRQIWLSQLTVPLDFNLLSVYQKLDIVLNHHENVKLTSQFLINAYDVRSKVISNLGNEALMQTTAVSFQSSDFLFSS